MTPEELKAAGEEYARRSRAEQGLPPHVEDPASLERIAVLLRKPRQPKAAS